MAQAGLAAGVGLAGCGADEEPAEDPEPETDPEPEPEPEEGIERAPATREHLESTYPGLLIHTPAPENGEAESRETYTKFFTPREEHYIRNHYVAPVIDENEWTIDLHGLVDEDVEISMDEIRNDYSTETYAHVMQCGGNGRSEFDPEIAGNPWIFGAVGNAEWTGTPLREIMDEYGAETGDNMWLMIAGADEPEGERVFARSIPMSKVMEDCILAYEMNGEPMTAEHGFPVRLVVPGWFGNNNVKWVDEMEVMDHMMLGDDTDAFYDSSWEGDGMEQYMHWQQNSYRMKTQSQESVRVRQIDEFDTWEQMDMEARGERDVPAHIYDQVTKSLIGTPGEGATVSPRDADGMVEIIGVAWAGDDEVEEVEVSTDGGDTWENAEFFNEEMREGYEPYAWRMFRYLWDPEEEGEYTLVSRATDEQGRTQPREISDIEDEQLTIEDDKFPYETGGYCLNAYYPHRVEVTIEME